MHLTSSKHTQQERSCSCARSAAGAGQQESHLRLACSLENIVVLVSLNYGLDHSNTDHGCVMGTGLGNLDIEVIDMICRRLAL